MKETIVLAPHSTSAELLRSLARYGKNSIGLRIVSSTELASLAMIRSGITCSSAFLNSRDQSSIIYSIISGGGIEYFSSASYADAESIAATLNGLRSLIKENETVEVENTLASGKFVEKNLAILRIYRNYLSVLSEKNLTDRIAYIREAIFKCRPFEAEFITLKEFPLAPVDKKLLETVSGGSYSVIGLSQLFEAADAPVHVEKYVSAYGAANEVEDIIGKIYESNIPLDKCIVAVTDTADYAQRFYDMSETYNIPMTFGCGIPILNTAPARLLKLAMKWQNEGSCGYDALREMVFSPAFDLSSVLAIFEGCEHPVSALDSALKVAGNLRLGFESDVNAARIEAYRNTLDTRSDAFQTLENTVSLFDILGNGYIGLLRQCSAIRKGPVGQLDKAALTTICDSIAAFTEYVSDNGAGIDNILLDVLSRTVRSENSSEGCLHICSIDSALSTVRENLFVAGLSSDCFPGAPKESFLLLDDDYAGYMDIAPTSENRLKNRRAQLDNVLRVYSALGSAIALSYPNFSHSSLKEINASSSILSYFREEHGRDITDDDYIHVGFFSHTLSPASALGREYLKGNQYPEVAPLPCGSVEFDLGRAYSPTAIETWFNCRRRFYLRYVLHIPEPNPDDSYTVIDSRAQGAIAHTLMESLRPDTDKAEFLSRASDAFDDFLASRPPIIPGSAEDVKEEFMDMLEYAFDSDPKNEVLASEEEVSAVHWSGLTVSGYPDRVEAASDGNNIIVDYKTGSSTKHKANDFNSCFQAVAYAWLMEKAAGLSVDHCEFRYPKARDVVPCIYDDSNGEKLDRVFSEFYAGLQSGDFSPAVKCDEYCRYTEICRKARKEVPVE